MNKTELEKFCESVENEIIFELIMNTMITSGWILDNNVKIVVNNNIYDNIDIIKYKLKNKNITYVKLNNNMINFKVFNKYVDSRIDNDLEIYLLNTIGLIVNNTYIYYNIEKIPKCYFNRLIEICRKNYKVDDCVIQNNNTLILTYYDSKNIYNYLKYEIYKN